MLVQKSLPFLAFIVIMLIMLIINVVGFVLMKIRVSQQAKFKFLLDKLSNFLYI